LWEGRNPLRIVLDRTLRLSHSLHLFDNTQKTRCYNAFKNEEDGQTTYVQIDFEEHFFAHLLDDLYRNKIQSLLVEGGAILLQSFLNEGIFDEIRIFKSPNAIGKGTAAPLLPLGLIQRSVENIGEDWLTIFSAGD